MTYPVRDNEVELYLHCFFFFSVPDIAIVSSSCSQSTVLTARSSEDILEKDKHT